MYDRITNHASSESVFVVILQSLIGASTVLNDVASGGRFRDPHTRRPLGTVEKGGGFGPSKGMFL